MALFEFYFVYLYPSNVDNYLTIKKQSYEEDHHDGSTGTDGRNASYK